MAPLMLGLHALVEQGDTGVSVVLVVSECGCAHRSVKESPFHLQSLRGSR